MRGGGAIEFLVIVGAANARRPIPIGTGFGGGFGIYLRAFAPEQETQASGCHQALLACCDHDIDAERIHCKPVAAERCDAIDRQQGRVGGLVYGVAQRGDVVADG